MTRFRFLACALSLASLSCRHAQDDSRTTIVFWHSFVSTTIPAFNALISDFEGEYPGIHIKAQYIPTGDGLVQKLITAIQSRTAPDVSWIHSDFLDKLVQSGAIYRMDHFLSGPDGMSQEELADILPDLLHAATWRDTLFALPMEATSLALFYNRDMFRHAGLDPSRPPRTWEELRDFAARLTVDEDRDGIFEQYGFFVPVFPASGPLNIWMNLQWTPFLWQAGGKEFADDQSHVLFNGPAGVQALTLWRDLYRDLKFSRYGLGHDVGFVSKNLAMILDGPWDLPRFRQMKGIDWAVAPLPAGPAGRATYIAGEHMTIFRQSEHPKEAWTFVKWMLRPDVQAKFSISSGYLPVRRSSGSLPVYRAFLEHDPAMKIFFEQLSVARGRQLLDRNRVEVNQCIADAIEQAALGGKDPAVALDEAAARANALLAPSAPGKAEARPGSRVR